MKAKTLAWLDNYPGDERGVVTHARMCVEQHDALVKALQEIADDEMSIHAGIIAAKALAAAEATEWARHASWTALKETRP
jgi:hypothetical protein